MRRALVAALVLAGCLPSSQKETDRSLAPGDSASLARADAAPVDTLQRVWTARAPESDPMAIPTTLAWWDDVLAVVETQNGSVRVFDDAGAYRRRIDLGLEGAFPYLAGVRGDTVVVLARGLDALVWVTDAGVARRVAVPPSTAALATPERLAVRVGGGASDAPAEVLTIGDGGAVRARAALAGPAWRASGFLRAWGDTVLALSGYRPVVDVVAPGARPDTLALDGFASPQFARSAQFMRGDADEPPLLTSSAAALGRRLFVLNLRGDHVRVDVYGRDGVLERALVSPRPWAPTDAVPLDLAVRQRGAATEIAVLEARPPGILSGPESRVVLYRWRPSS